VYSSNKQLLKHLIACLSYFGCLASSIPQATKTFIVYSRLGFTAWSMVLCQNP